MCPGKFLDLGKADALSIRELIIGGKSRAKRCKHGLQVTFSAGGSAQLELAPGSMAQRAMRQCGVTA